MSLKESLGEKLAQYANTEFNYIETKRVEDAAQLDYGISGIYMEATILYFEIKNLPFLLKENGRRKTVQAFTMIKEVLSAIAENENCSVNCFSPNAFLVVFPGREETLKDGVRYAMKVSQALGEDFKQLFADIPGVEFSMGLDHGHIMGTKCQSDCGYDKISWFGSCIYKAMRISKECARPFYIGISGTIYHNLGEEMRIAQRHILGIKKSVDIWTKVSYQYDNVKKHLYQTNHKIPIDEA